MRMEEKEKEEEKESNAASLGGSCGISGTAPDVGVSMAATAAAAAAATAAAAVCDRCSSVPSPWHQQTLSRISSPVVPTLPESVYEPAEDTYLFMDVLEREILSSRPPSSSAAAAAAAASLVGGDPAAAGDSAAALRRPMLGLDMGSVSIYNQSITQPASQPGSQAAI
eukprot:GHVU01029351.1.p1 GENE.GHVU01029351.1~~GHVU01029351.1.p1  ORF type:complete len:168 (+),score=56.59 GHVU01029351.1:139-642(+)